MSGGRRRFPNRISPAVTTPLRPAASMRARRLILAFLVAENLREDANTRSSGPPKRPHATQFTRDSMRGRGLYALIKCFVMYAGLHQS